jgi:uncharacterized membrane protein
MVESKKKVEKKTSSGTIENEKLVSILAYFLVGIIWYFADEKVKKSNITKFHTKQALNLLIISVAISIIYSIIMAVLTPLFLFGGFVLMGIFSLLALLINLCILVLWILGLINAINQKQKEIPIIGGFANKYLTF